MSGDYDRQLLEGYGIFHFHFKSFHKSGCLDGFFVEVNFISILEIFSQKLTVNCSHSVTPKRSAAKIKVLAFCFGMKSKLKLQDSFGRYEMVLSINLARSTRSVFSRPMPNSH